MSQAPAPKLNLRKLESIQRLLQYGAVLVLLVFIALIVFSWFQLRGINRDIASKKEELRSADATIAQQNKEIEKNLGIINSQKELIGGLTESTRAISENNPAQGNLIKETIENSIGQDTNIAEIPPRIYIQIAREDQRKAAGEMARQLQARGFVVPGIENIQGKASVPSVTQLRYYQTGASQDDVNKISEYIRSINIKLDVPGPLRSGKARPRHYELWFSNDFPPRRTPVRIDTPIKLPEKVETPNKVPEKLP